MFDIIGKRNWFFAFSLLITIPGLIFILLGPITGGKVGLQYAIDFTGGTVWSIRFEDPNINPDQVERIVNDKGYEAQVTKSGDGFMEIRTKEAALAAPEPVATPLPSASAGASGSPEASGSPAASASPAASSSPAASASPATAPVSPRSTSSPRRSRASRPTCRRS